MSFMKSNIKKYIDMEVVPYIINLKTIIDDLAIKIANDLRNEVTSINNRISSLESDLTNHINNKNNPHDTTIDSMIFSTQFRAPVASEGKDNDYFVELIK